VLLLTIAGATAYVMHICSAEEIYTVSCTLKHTLALVPKHLGKWADGIQAAVDAAVDISL
jgi:hypothetical protein